MASRTVGSPQIRNRGTVGGNLGTASPAGDAHPPLLAAGAVVEVGVGARARRVIPIDEFFPGVKRNALAPDELIRAVLVPPAPGPQQFAQGRHPQRHGDRGLLVRGRAAPGPQRGRHRASARPRPTPRRAPAAEEFLAAELRRGTARGRCDDDLVRGSSAQLVARRRRPDRRRARHRRATAGTPWRCWPAAPLTWAWARATDAEGG